MRPTERVRLCRLANGASFALVYCRGQRASLTVSASTPRMATTMASADSTRSARMCSSMAQPITREQPSRTVHVLWNPSCTHLRARNGFYLRGFPPEQGFCGLRRRSIPHNAQIQPALPGAQIGDIGRPHP
jgi:hypothetical protein